MKRAIQRLSAVLCLLSLFCFSAVLYGRWTIPDTVPVLAGEQPQFPHLYGSPTVSTKPQQVRFLRSIAVKKSRITSASRVYAVPLGSAFGIKMYTDGVVVVRVDTVPLEHESVSPAQQAGIRTGDRILSANGQPVQTNAQLAQVMIQSAGKSVALRVRRDGLTFDTQLTPVLSVSDGKYHAGIWVRDSSAGIGTLTMYVPSYGLFSGLGHAVCDVDTGQVVPLSSGEAVSAVIKGSYKGRTGTPGELCGVFGDTRLGTLICNTDSGVYGSASSIKSGYAKMPVALYYEVQQGEAQILSQVDGDGTKAYTVEITKLFPNPDAHQKNLIVKVTDPELLQKTGGIVQGMSGSPIIQNGMIVGAVTHVFINDPKQGFGVYAQTMIDEMEKLSNRKNAS